MLLEVLLIAFGAGVIGTFVGGVVGVIVKNPGKLYIALMLAFAAGVMISVSFFELLPESYEDGGMWAMTIGLAVGALFVWGIGLMHDKASQKVICEDGETGERCRLKKTGIAILIAMALHGLPEGLAIGAGEHLGIGLLLGIVLFLHFVPEGLAIAVPLKASGMKTWKILLYCLAAGLPTVVGAVIGYYLGQIEVLLAYSLSFAAGAMLFVSISEMLPKSYEYSSRHRLITTVTLAGAMLIVVFATLLH